MPNRTEYYRSTTHICNKLSDRPAGQLLQKAIKYNFGDLGVLYGFAGDPVEVQMVQQDVIDVLTNDVGNNLNPLVVVPTTTQACGGWDLGEEGFEESLAYRTTLSMSLQDSLYPIKNACVYSPHVSVIRDAKYNLRKNSFQIAAVTLTPQPSANFSIENDKKRMLDTIDMAFQVALKHSHQSLVFNAFGCHEDNNPGDVAMLMGQIITRYSRAVKRVTIVFDFEANSPKLLAFRKNMQWSIADKVEPI